MLETSEQKIHLSDEVPRGLVAGLRRFRLGAALVHIIEGCAVAFMGGIAILVFANAFSRYAFGRPLPWTDEVVPMLLVWVTAVGIVLASLRGALISCDILTSRLPGVVARIVSRSCAIFGALTMGVLGWYVWQYMGLFGSDLTPMLRLPKSVIFSGLLLGAVGMVVSLLLRIRH
ncbi:MULTISPECIES: TRAP transporter small permease [Halomonadaceae]|uniref:TRAP transporter small permease protein n=2 Tax=Vreelandella TaxID=3137766 RepID=A0A7Z0S023_9GAMM|nr:MULTISPECIES: TRAP transporter small permease [Halomonas]NYS79949.1 TRAP transporter small permease [Halomonas glaciei]|tara:strand:- start:41194 stop:41715 length:522 start_codon:yes stop_codon:yes gene_type:complete